MCPYGQSKKGVVAAQLLYHTPVRATNRWCCETRQGLDMRECVPFIDTILVFGKHI